MFLENFVLTSPPSFPASKKDIQDDDKDELEKLRDNGPCSEHALFTHTLFHHQLTDV